MIEIKDISGKTLMTVPVSSGAISHEELMKSDYIQLEWNSPVGDILPAGVFIEYDGEKYSLLEPYQPACTSEAEYQYTPQFQSRIMAWDKHPVPLYTYDDEGNVVSREFDWEFTGSPADVLYMVKQAIMHEVGEEWTYQLSDSLPATVSLQSQSSSIFSILSELAEDCETEWWVDKKNNLLHLSKCEHGEQVMLTAGQNVKMPSITNSKDGYYTRFYVFGSTKNITQDYQSGQATNHIVNKRLTLDPVKYPGGYKDIKGHFDNGVFVSDLLPGEIFPKSLYFDNIFPSSKLTITNVRPRAKYRLDSNGNKIQIGGTEDEPVYEQYAIWYFRVEGLDFDPQTIIEGKNLSVSFESGQLEGRDFELTYHEKDQTVKDAADVTAFEVKAGDFEIIIDESTGSIIPGALYIIPQDGDKIVLYNIEMPDEYTTSAQVELEAEIDKEIARRIADNNTYEFDSNPVDFYNHGTDVELGQAVRFSFGGGTLETRVLMVEKRLDGIYQQRIRIGNEQIKGVTQELKEDVANANQNIDIIKAFNELSSSLSNAYANAQREMIEGFAAIRNMWRFDPENPNTIYSSYNVYSLGEVAAGGPGSSSGGGTGGLDENQLWAILANTGTEQISKTHLVDALSGYATENWVLAKNYLTSAALSGYATQSWVTAQGYITSAALEGYATIADVDNRIDDLINGAPAAYDTLKEIADVLQGNVDSIGDIITTLGTKADKVISISAGTGLTGGGNLSASRTLSLATVGTAGTYTKVIVDAYGRVTGHSALAEADIPTLSIAKISGLQTALDNKLDESVFTDLFEKVQVDGNTFIKAKYNLFSIGEVAAGGAGTGSGSSGGIDEAQLWSVLGNSGTEQIAKNHLTTALSGYATETWVTGKGYATQSWVTSKGYITSAALEGYATESWVTGKNYLTAITKAMVEAVLTGNITTHTHSQYLTAHQAIYALTIKAGSTTAVTFSPKTAAATLTLEAGSGISLSADATAKKITIANTYKYTLPTASASVLGGVKIGANITITNGVISTHAPYSHPTATANTITAATGKVLSAITVNNLGHVTSVAAKTLAAGDIPTLSISKISGLQTTLDSKLNASVFNDLFEKVTEDGQTFIKAKYNFYSIAEVAAGGAGTGSGGTGGGIDEEQLWAILGNSGDEQIAKNHLTSALAGYLTTVNLATITDLHSNWDAVLKVAPASYVTRWPSFAEVTSKPTTLSGYGITDAVTIGTTQTITGSKTFSRDAASVVYVKNSAASNTSQYVAVRFTHGSSDVGGIAGDKDGSALYRVNSGFTTVYKLLDTSNYTSTLDTRYVKKAGDTMTGLLTITSGSSRSGIRIGDSYLTAINKAIIFQNIDNIRFGSDSWDYNQWGGLTYKDKTIYLGAADGTIFSKNNTGITDAVIKTPGVNKMYIGNNTTNIVWHAGNDGSGSGLDADLLDGYHRSNLYTSESVFIDATGRRKDITVTGDANTYYPVAISISGANTKVMPQKISVYRNLGETCANYSGNHSEGTSSMWIVYEYRFTGWDGNGGFLRTTLYSMPYANLCAKTEVETKANGLVIIYLRGGGTIYHIASTGDLNSVTAYYNSNSNVGTTSYPTLVSPTTSIGNKGIYSYGSSNSYINIAGNAATATKLQTPRTIWGQSFDGTANISGALTGATDIIASGNIQATSLYAKNGGYFYNDSGWFQNNKTGTGLYNKAEDARWYASGGNWRTDKTILPTTTNAYQLGSSSLRWSNIHSVLGNFSGLITASAGISSTTGTFNSLVSANRIKITDTDAVKHIEFSRASYNYITTPANGYICFQVDGAALSAAACDLQIQSGSIHSGTTNTTTCGTSSYRWSNIYSVLGNFSGAVTMSSTANIANNLTVGGQIRANGGYIFLTNTSGGDGIYLAANDTSAGIYIHNNYSWANTVMSFNISTGNITIEKSLSSKGAVTMSSTLAVSGTSTFTGKTTHNGGLASTTGSFSSTLSVTGAATLSSTLSVASTLTASNGIVTDYDGSTWISMATRSNLIRSTTNNSTSNAHALFRVKNSGGDAIIFGGLGTNCGFYGITAEYINAGTNGTNWSTVWDVSTGKLVHNKAMSVAGAVTLSSTLSVVSTSTFTGKTTHNGGIACANGLTLSSGELMLGSSSNQKIRKGAASATYWSQLEFFGTKASNGGFTDIMLNIQSSHTIQFDCGGNFIWFSKGNIAAKGELAAGSSSDRRLKKILSTADYRKRLLSLGDVVDYEYNDKAFKRNARTTEHRRYTGLIYQNVVNVLPQMAGMDDDGYGYLNYIHTDYINLIAGALQQTIRRQETIEQRVERLERENEELKQQLKRLAA